jgi:chemotaxis protein methyltransferase CheR
MVELTDKEFITLRDYVLNNYGIDLSKKRVLIQGRLAATLAQRGLTGYTEYIDQVMTDKSGVEVNLLLNKLTTNLTYFMREREHFDFVRDVALPEVDRAGKREIRVWSAGCSSGEEPYTLAMLMMEYYAGKPGAPRIAMLASDISQKVLGEAQLGEYREEGLKDLPPAWKTRYFDKLPSGMYRVKDAVRRNVAFKTVNLMDPFRFAAPFELIFCRNVMIYFEKQRKKELVDKFCQWTAPGFYFIISHSENIERGEVGFRMLKPSIFRREP